MKKTRKWLAALGSAFLLAVALLVPGIGEVKAAEPTMTVSIGDVPDAKVGEEIEIPITISSSDGLRGAVGKLNDENGALYDTGVLEYLGASNSLGADMSTAGGNYGFITMSEFHEVTINLKFKVLKCQPAPVSVTTKDLYASTASASTGKKNLTAIVTIAHGDLHEEVTKQATKTAAGSKTVTCGLCGYKAVEEIPAGGGITGGTNGGSSTGGQSTGGAVGQSGGNQASGGSGTGNSQVSGGSGMADGSGVQADGSGSSDKTGTGETLGTRADGETMKAGETAKTGETADGIAESGKNEQVAVSVKSSGTAVIWIVAVLVIVIAGGALAAVLVRKKNSAK